MKHKLQLLLCFLFLGVNAFSQNIPSYVPTNGLVGWWPFNGNANDESGNGNHGTVNGATLTSDRNGVAGKAYSFDGTNYIQVPHSNDLNLKNGSISFWFKSNQTSLQTIIYKTEFGTAANENYAVGINTVNNNEISFYVKYNSNCVPGQGWENCQTPNLYSNNTYHHFLGVIDRDSLKVYINGNQKSSHKVPNFNADNCQFSPLYFARDWATNQLFNFKGSLDDIAIYKRALTQKEIKAL
jgi:hypothetical protein